VSDTSTTADLVIIGAGISGAAAAYYAAELGVKALVLDKGAIGSEQSSRAWGYVRQQGRDPVELALMMASNALWQNLEQALDADVEWRMSGNLGIAHTETTLQKYRQWMSVAAAAGLDTRLVDANEVQALLPGLHGEWAGGLTTASDGHADPAKTTAAFAAAAQRAGAEFREGCGVVRLLHEGDKIKGVLTERGAIATERVICAAGAWSSRLLRPAKVNLPQLRVRGTVAMTDAADRTLVPIAAWTPEVAFRQRPNGSIVIAQFDAADHDLTLDSLLRARQFRKTARDRPGHFKINFGRPALHDLADRLIPDAWKSDAIGRTAVPAPGLRASSAQSALEALHRTLPATRELSLADTWSCYMDLTPDMLPILGPVDPLAGLTLATGLSGHGFGMGPIIGTLAARLALELDTGFDLTPFALARFTNGGAHLPQLLR
jgi:glycine/D-amino acid oxidase-like deaminating enzyme